jgi:hypothetical protein
VNTLQIQTERRLLTVIRPSRAEIAGLYRQMTIAYWAEALALQRNDPALAEHAAQIRVRANQSIMSAISG